MALAHETHIKITIGLAAGFVSTLVLGVILVVTFVKKTEYNIQNNAQLISFNTEDIQENRVEITAVKEEVDDVKITYTVLNTKLANIETGIVELKEMMKDKD